jgi:antitoxin CptB
MTGTQRSSDGLSARRKKILFRAWHRGMREMDLLLGQFADAMIGELTDEQLDTLELLMDVPDRDVLAWLTREKETPENFKSDVFQMIITFHDRKSALSNT